MERVTFLRTKMSKLPDVALTIGIDATQNIDPEHDLYFLRSMLDFKRVCEKVEKDSPFHTELKNMANRHLFIFRNDDKETLKKSIVNILTLCKWLWTDVAFSEYEIRPIIPELFDLAEEFEVNVFITTF